MASWGSTGGWKENAVVLKSRDACASLKNLLGESWFSINNCFNIKNENCPIPTVTSFIFM